jgi:HK97 family phage major capsid protein
MSTRSIEDLNRVTYRSSAASDFAAYAKAMLAARFNHNDALQFASRGSARVRDILQKAPVLTSDTSDASALIGYREISVGFAASLAPWSSYDRIYNDGSFTRVPLKTRISIASSAATGSSVSELAPKPISEMTFGLATLEPSKVTSFIVISNELARSVSPAAATMLGNELRRACALATDTAFLATLAGSTGVASSASTGISAAQFLADLDTALQAVTVGANSKLYLIVPPALWKTIVLMRDNGGPVMSNGLIGGVIRVVASDAATYTATLVDATQVATESDVITLSEGTHASLQMDDAPTDGAQQLVSLWQANLVGLKAERMFAVEVLRSEAVALITGISVSA